MSLFCAVQFTYGTVDVLKSQVLFEIWIFRNGGKVEMRRAVGLGLAILEQV